jgi:hypothetical protein
LNHETLSGQAGIDVPSPALAVFASPGTSLLHYLPIMEAFEEHEKDGTD